MKLLKAKLKEYYSFAEEVFSEFSTDNATKLSASLSYYTIFSLAPMLVVIISVAGIFYGREAIQGQLYGQIDWLIGKDAAAQVEELIKNARLSQKSGLAAIIGTVTLMLGATGVFAEIQDSINFIWSLKAKPKSGILKYLFNRLLSFSLILSLGFLLIVSLLVNTFLDIFSQRLQLLFENMTVYLFMFLNLTIVFSVITLLFATIFKVLPDGRIAWKDAFLGAGVTAVLFMVGKFLIGYYLGQSKITSTFGAAGSVVIILLWVYYSSTILFLGAEFTKVYTRHYGTPIQPNRNAVLLVKKEIEVKEPKIH
ncbi:YihY/virulence factor BrkB family protein [Emticicia sp. BO119]|uniref:YihY/virulence factor BrkB family protein n=1 Tax=Emticicia sp. BO119 TaxID=2757768 RepID=UPI0015F06E6B|nr:YihY/virulence factor BrkB family protein [Emticicia sp. BO119]MBA4853997.1 YihY/virulence factor BrkB family protein [Emticicia sp. BO119]